jgi:signal transduction histidine kinase
LTAFHKEERVESDAGSRPEFLPQLQLDELLSELQSRLQVVLATRDQMRGLLEAVIAISAGLDLPSTLRRIVETAVRLVDATYGALGVIGGGRLTEFIPVGLSEEQIGQIDALGAAAGIAIENARLYDAARRSQRWIQASAEFTTALLSGAETGEVLARITSQARELSDADLALLALPDEQGKWLTVAYADGDGAETVRGVVLPAGQSLSGQVLATGDSVTIADFAADERASAAARAAMSQVGPAVLFPLGAPGRRRGVFTIGRRHGRRPFPQAEASYAASFAAQAGVALELAASRAEAERLSVYQDRDRIARDLHDLVIQRLYATGMSLQGAMPMIGRPEVADRVTRAVDAMDETIREIRGAIFALQARDAEVARDPRADIVRLVEDMTEMLGFAPSLRLGPGLRTLGSEELAEQALIVLREALSNVARHAGATRADVTVDIGDDGFLTVTVSDNGTGIPRDPVAAACATSRSAPWRSAARCG